MENNKDKTDIQEFLDLMEKLNIVTYLTFDEYDCAEIRLKIKHHNSVPMFYFDETGKFVDVSTAIANEQCNTCGSLSIYKIND